ncbi:MAG: AMP-binding protein [Desulfobacteraceae bacterium]|nr:AMP-binding protein [Desulfobacteraceae bacterium]
MNASMIFGDIVTRGTLLSGSSPAFIWGRDRQRTYAEMEDRVSSIVMMLEKAGVKQGTRLALLSSNNPEFLEFCFAASFIGAVIVPLNIRLHPDELNFQIKDSEASYAVIDPELEKTAREAGLFDLRHWVIGDDLEKSLEPASFNLRNFPRVSPEIPLIQLYTSGTTGKPKGCLSSQIGWLVSNSNVVNNIQINSDDRLLGVYPFFHVAGFSYATSTLLAGGTVIIPDSAVNENLWNYASSHNATITAFPAFPQALDYATENGIDTGSIRGVLGGANMVKQKIFDQLHEVIPNAVFYGTYGCTEGGGCVTLCTQKEELEKPGTVGRPLLCFDAAILGKNDEILPDGEVGELCLRGQSTMIGYWKRPEATKEALRGGWIHTGDLMSKDKDGYLYFVDRSKDMIKSGGENVYSIEVETILLKHPDIVDAAVVGVPDKKWDESVKAVIVTEPGSKLQADDLDKFCLEKLSPYKRPRWYEFVDQIPRNETNKLLKRKLRDTHDPSKCVRLGERS